MIVLDTNVVSETMRSAPDPTVLAWLAARNPLDLATTTITLAEIRRGIMRLPDGRRQRSLEDRFAAFIGDAFAGRLFAFDEAAAYSCAAASAARERAGLHVDAVDMMIAGIVKAQGAALATRNVADFGECGFALVDPWRSRAPGSGAV